MGTKNLGITRGADIFKVPFEKIICEPTKNGRIDYGDIEGLALSILENGQKQPIHATKTGNTPETLRFILRDGFRRYAAIKYIREELKQDFPYILVMGTGRNYTEIDGLFEQIVSNDGKPFNMLEEGNVYKALTSQGEIESTIAKRIGKSPQHVKNCLLLAELPANLKEYIINDHISCTFMLQLAREHVDYEELETIIQERLSEKEAATSKNQTAIPFETGDGTIDTESEYDLPPKPERKCKLTKKDFEFDDESKPENENDNQSGDNDKSYSGDISESPIVSCETGINMCYARGIGDTEKLELATAIIENIKRGGDAESYVKLFTK